MTLQARVAAITGAGRGLGLLTAERLASAGWDLVLCSRTATELDLVSSDLMARFGVRVIHRAVAVEDEPGMRAFIAEVESQLGPVRALVNNAAVLGPVGPLVDVDMTRWAEAVRINLVGTAVCAAVVGEAMIASGGGAIVNLAGGGIGGPSVSARISAYTCSKAAVVALTESLAVEFAPSVRVNVVAPGAIATSFTDEILESGPGAAGPDLYEQTRSHRDGSPPVDPYLELLEWLLSPDADWITGRFLSARWESVRSLTAGRHAIERSDSLFRLRRVDNDLFMAVDQAGSA